MNPLGTIVALLLSREEPDPKRDLLLTRGWVPFGKNSVTGLEGWGKMIDGQAVIVDQPEALKREAGGAA